MMAGTLSDSRPWSNVSLGETCGYSTGHLFSRNRSLYVLPCSQACRLEREMACFDYGTAAELFPGRHKTRGAPGQLVAGGVPSRRVVCRVNTGPTADWLAQNRRGLDRGMRRGACGGPRGISEEVPAALGVRRPLMSEWVRVRSRLSRSGTPARALMTIRAVVTTDHPA
jgi:hypothetical protein